MGRVGVEVIVENFRGLRLIIEVLRELALCDNDKGSFLVGKPTYFFRLFTELFGMNISGGGAYSSITLNLRTFVLPIE